MVLKELLSARRRSRQLAADDECGLCHPSAWLEAAADAGGQGTGMGTVRTWCFRGMQQELGGTGIRTEAQGAACTTSACSQHRG